MKIVFCILFLGLILPAWAQDEEAYIIRAFNENGKKLGAYTIAYLDSYREDEYNQVDIYRIASKGKKVYICQKTVHCAWCFPSGSTDFSWRDTEDNLIYKATQKISKEELEIFYKANPKRDIKVLAMLKVTHHSQKTFYALLMNSKEENTDDGYINKHEYWLLGETGKILQKFTLTAYDEVLLIIPYLFDRR
jgi:hypothetical protein